MPSSPNPTDTVKKTAKHTVHRLTLDIQFADFATSEKWVSKSQMGTAEAMRRSIERCLEDFELSNDYLTVKKVEIDLGVFGSDDLLLKMPEMLYRELEKVLNLSTEDMDLDKGDMVDAVYPSAIAVHRATKSKGDGLVKHSKIDAFFFFLQQGHLPWWHPDVPVWDQKWLEKLTNKEWREVYHFLSQPDDEAFHKPKILRLVFQFSDNFLANLLKGLQLQEPVGKAWAWVERLYVAMGKVAAVHSQNESSLPSISVIRCQFWEKWILYSLGRSNRPTLATLVANSNRLPATTFLLLSKIESKEWLDNVPQFWQEEFISLIQQGQPYKNRIEVKDRFNKEVEPPKPLPSPPETDHGRESLSDKTDFILVPGAGVVLLHPFLPRLFEICNWVDKHQFWDGEAQTGAIYALYYLATGEEDGPEFMMMIPKLLCGVPFEFPLERLFRLTDAEKAACDEMLLQVIKHWTALRKTSPAGLRHTFLGRQGTLLMTEQGWNLEIQRKTEDILLNRLPWGFSQVKFPWMHRLLSVAWE